jgi:hypothetical protein
MIMRFILVVFICLSGVYSLQAQTRKIAHRSHSGQPATFALVMGDDHAGAYNPPPELYDLEPFVAKIKKHYEDQAKRTAKDDKKAEASLKAEPTASPKDSIVPGEIQPSPGEDRTEPQKQHRNGKARNGKEEVRAEEGAQVAEVVSYPLAKELPAVDHTDSNSSPLAGLWLLMGGLVLTVGPGVYWLSGKKA